MLPFAAGSTPLVAGSSHKYRTMSKWPLRAAKQMALLPYAAECMVLFSHTARTVAKSPSPIRFAHCMYVIMTQGK
jgi:hypothetical protein